MTNKLDQQTNSKVWATISFVTVRVIEELGHQQTNSQVWATISCVTVRVIEELSNQQTNSQVWATISLVTVGVIEASLSHVNRPWVSLSLYE